MRTVTSTEKQQESRVARFRVRPAYIVLAVILAIFAWRFIEKTQTIRSLASQEAALRWENQRTSAENTRLQRNIQYYRTPQFVQERARAIFGDTLPGDMSVQSQPVMQALRPAVSAAPPRPPSPPDPTWKRWWNAFFGG